MTLTILLIAGLSGMIIAALLYRGAANRYQMQMNRHKAEVRRWRTLIRENDVVFVKDQKFLAVVRFVTSETVLVEDANGNMHSINKEMLVPYV